MFTAERIDREANKEIENLRFSVYDWCSWRLEGGSGGCDNEWSKYWGFAAVQLKLYGLWWYLMDVESDAVADGNKSK
ncbi:hypothetical protein C5167_041919 [Papaver somniferum]|nr:hypothetical protein C5167_041919 [Papaver somniferum]